MRRRSAAAVAMGALVLAAGASAATPAKLRITVWPEGRGHGSTMWTLRCAPAGGTLPARARACRGLASARAPFAPVRPGTACTEIYGGPQVAHVRGTFRGRPVDAWFNRQDGCEIQRWQAVRFLFPATTR